MFSPPPFYRLYLVLFLAYCLTNLEIFNCLHACHLKLFFFSRNNTEQFWVIIVFYLKVFHYVSVAFLIQRIFTTNPVDLEECCSIMFLRISFPHSWVNSYFIKYRIHFCVVSTELTNRVSNLKKGLFWVQKISKSKYEI